MAAGGHRRAGRLRAATAKHVSFRAFRSTPVHDRFRRTRHRYYVQFGHAAVARDNVFATKFHPAKSKPLDFAGFEAFLVARDTLEYVHTWRNSVRLGSQRSQPRVGRALAPATPQRRPSMASTAPATPRLRRISTTRRGAALSPSFEGEDFLFQLYGAASCSRTIACRTKEEPSRARVSRKKSKGKACSAWSLSGSAFIRARSKLPRHPSSPDPDEVSHA